MFDLFVLYVSHNLDIRFLVHVRRSRNILNNDFEDNLSLGLVSFAVLREVLLQAMSNASVTLLCFNDLPIIASSTSCFEPLVKGRLMIQKLKPSFYTNYYSLCLV